LVSLFAYRSDYEFGCRTGTETPLSKTLSDVRTDAWQRIASGKGVLLLNELRSEIGAETFERMMDDFGRDNAGKAVTTAQFKASAEKAAGKKLDEFFDTWLNKTGLPATKTEIGSAKSIYSVQSFFNEEEDTLIVYGTLDEQNTNREAAEALQQAIRERHSNYTVPIKTDAAVSEEDMKTHHVVLIGRPDTNRVVAQLGDALAIKFGKQSFVVRNEAYANAESAVIAAAENPLNKRYSVVVATGLNAASTLRTAARLARVNRAAEVVVFPKNGMPRNLVMLGKPAEPRAGE
jgi:aminopeptidase N